MNLRLICDVNQKHTIRQIFLTHDKEFTILNISIRNMMHPQTP
jgi:hypothetical protein